jgi:hypothetical protein
MHARYLNDSQTHGFVKSLNQYFQSKIKIPSVGMGEQQKIETLACAKLFSPYFRTTSRLISWPALENVFTCARVPIEALAVVSWVAG